VRRYVILDAGPLGLASQAPDKPDAAKCIDWIKGVQDDGSVVAVPEIARYEIRRELVRVGATAGLRRLDGLHPRLDFLPLTSVVMDRASELWAHVRRAGKPTAPDEALDGDAILAAQALVAAETGDEVVIATTNVAHLARFSGVDARPWWTVA
jgi:predicted nucleic acid-binding protein